MFHCNIYRTISIHVSRPLDTASHFAKLDPFRCQHQRTKKRDRADEKAKQAGVSIYIVHRQVSQLVL